MQHEAFRDQVCTALPSDLLLCNRCGNRLQSKAMQYNLPVVPGGAMPVLIRMGHMRFDGLL